MAVPRHLVAKIGLWEIKGSLRTSDGRTGRIRCQQLSAAFGESSGGRRARDPKIKMVLEQAAQAYEDMADLLEARPMGSGE
jgi:hypothetical protein